MRYFLVVSAFLTGVLITMAMSAFTRTVKQEGYVLVHEKDIAKEEPGSHNGGGKTTAYSFFEKIPDLQLIFRKRVLQPGSSIGYHLQEKDEIYYIIDGEGEMNINGKSFPVSAGDAVLTRPGNSHGLKVMGAKNLTVLINYNK